MGAPVLIKIESVLYVVLVLVTVWAFAKLQANHTVVNRYFIENSCAEYKFT
jgi:hypothetical protein